MTLAANNLIENNLKLVHYVINEFTKSTYTERNSLYDSDDLFQIGCIGLTKAAKFFNEAKGSFSSYAISAIRNEIYMAFNYQAKGEDTTDFDFDKGDALEKRTEILRGELDCCSKVMYDCFKDDLVSALPKKMQSDAKKILSMLEMGYRENEAADILGLAPARVYRIVRKIRLTYKEKNTSF